MSSGTRFILPVVSFVALLALATFAPPLLGDRAAAMTYLQSLDAGAAHPLGTDAFGRDLLARTLVATRTTLLTASAAATVAIAAGTLVAVAAQLAPARLRAVAERLVDLAVVFPALLIALVVAASVDNVAGVVLAIGLGNAPAFARLVLVLCSGLLRSEHVVAARLVGVPSWRIGTRYLLPNAAEPLVIVASQLYAGVLIEMAGLSFLGFGVQPPDSDWGSLLSEALPAIYTHPVQVVGPSLMIVLTGMTALTLGDALARCAHPLARRGLTSAPSAPQLPEEALRTVALSDDADALVRIRRLELRGRDGRLLVDGIDLDLRRDERLVIVGASGSGKSLIAAAIAGVLPPGVRAEGTLWRAPSAQRASFVFQDPAATFSPASSIGVQARDALRGTGRWRTQRRELLAALDRLDVPDPKRVLASRPWQLSGGMLQRTVLALALVAKHGLLIADEPTSALDSASRERLLLALEGIRAEIGSALVVVTHDISLAERLADRVVVISAGRVVESLSGEKLRTGAARHEHTLALLAARTERLRLNLFLEAFGSIPDHGSMRDAETHLIGRGEEAA